MPDRTPFSRSTEEMLAAQLIARGISDPAVLNAMREIDRKQFVSQTHQRDAYADHPLAIGFDQTISQPYIVALMTEQLAVTSHHRVLEIGTGSGYQTAILSRLVKEVYTVERIAELSNRAHCILSSLQILNVRFRIGDGYEGWPEHAPYDRIMVTAAPLTPPQPLLDQLGPGGIMVIPTGDGDRDGQTLRKLTRTPGGFRSEEITDVRFVPLLKGVLDESTE